MAGLRQRSPTGVVVCLVTLALALPFASPATSAELEGSVSGVVTADGAPLATAWVVLTPVTATGDWAGTSLQVATDENGRYTFEDIEAAHVKVHVRSPLTGNHVATFWPGVFAFGQAGTVAVKPGGSVADIDLPAGRTVEGQVVAEDTGEPVEGVLLVARIADAPWAEPVGRFEPGAGQGGFEITGLPPVPIRLHVQVPRSSPFLGDGYYSSGMRPEARRRVEEPGDVTGLVIRLPRGGVVAGTVRDARGQPMAGASVQVENCRYGCPREAISDDSGAFTIRGIPPSDRLIVHARAPGTIDQWFAGASEWTAATLISLRVGEVRRGVDFVLVPGAFLVARVIDGDTDLPLSGVAAYLESVVAPGRRHFADSTQAGGYRIGPVPPDTYRLVLLPTTRQAQYRPARWLTATGIDTSGLIRLDSGDEVEVVVRLARATVASSAASPSAPPDDTGAGAPNAATKRPTTGSAPGPTMGPTTGPAPGPPADPAAGPTTPPAECAAGDWLGLFRGFLGDAPWPLPTAVTGSRVASRTSVVRSE